MRVSFLTLVVLLVFAALGAAEERRVDANFKPQLVKAELPADQVRPGETLPLTLHFKNEGSAAAARDYRVFVHFEPQRNCDTIAFSYDHEPTVSTMLWTPGKQVTDGPHGVPVPPTAAEGKYWLHVGVYVWSPVQARFCEEYVKEIQVSRDAPTLRDQRPPLPAAEVARRRAAHEARMINPVTVQSKGLRLRMDPATGAYDIQDKASGMLWHSHPFQPRFGEATVRVGENRQRLVLTQPAIEKLPDGLRLTFRGEGSDPASVAVRLRLLADGRTLDCSYEAGKNTQVEGIRLLDDALWLTDADPGFALVPVREGMMVPADSGRMFHHHFPTSVYEGCHMQMLGLLKAGSAALITWNDVNVTAELRSTLVDSDQIPGRQVLAPSLSLRKSANSFQVQFLGKGDAVTVARAYREVARARGLVQTWADKTRRNPEAAKLIGASNVKLWSTLSRRIGEDGKELSAQVNWTFDEAADVAEHLKNDLKLDRVLFILGGWIHRGYDNQHPDILPAAPECGGNEKFAEAARRIRATGYVLGLHDNYQDIYRDSPSWDERLIMKNAKGELVKGGKWAGGQAWLTCSKQAVALAKRPQNLPAVRALAGPAAYFIDTTYAVGPQECHDPEHPLTFADDLKYKKEISDYARDTFGLFGSECGREWAIPHSDFFEGLTGVSGRYYHNAAIPDSLGATVIPLFEMVYRDCMAMYGKYGYSPSSAASYVLHHLSIGRPLNYHSMGSHRYWEKPEEQPMPLAPGTPTVEVTGPRTFRIAYAWNVTGPLSGTWRAFVHFTDADGKILFQDDYIPEQPLSQWARGEKRIAPRTVTVPENLSGPFRVQVGLCRADRVEVRARLAGPDNGSRSYPVGTITLTDKGPRFQAEAGLQSAGQRDCFVRADGGWAEGMHPMDRFLKNTHEVLSPLHELTATMLVTGHEFLTPDRRAQRTTFGESVRVTINDREQNLTVRRADGSEVVLPPFGFLVESPQFVAFHALNWGSVKYDSPVLFTLRSLDGKALAASKRVRVFHGFGDARLEMNGKVVRVPREQILP